jgi:hypothetical protein
MNFVPGYRAANAPQRPPVGTNPPERIAEPEVEDSELAFTPTAAVATADKLPHRNSRSWNPLDRGWRNCRATRRRATSVARSQSATVRASSA